MLTVVKPNFVQGLPVRDLGVSADEKTLIAGIVGSATVRSNDPEVIAWAQGLQTKTAAIRSQPIRKLSPVLYAIQHHSSDETDVAMALGAAFRTQMAAGFTGKLPCASMQDPTTGKRRLMDEHAFADAQKSLDQALAFEAFAEVIKSSACPLVAKLREAMEAAYVQNNLELVCEAVGLCEVAE
jgi:hypothetical protein